MTLAGRRIDVSAAVMSVGLCALYVFLYAPILYVVYTSFAADIVWPFPPAFTLSAYGDLFDSSLYGEALSNSLKLAFGSATISTGNGERPVSASTAGPRPRSVSTAGWIPRASSRSSAVAPASIRPNRSCRPSPTRTSCAVSGARRSRCCGERSRSAARATP